MIQVLELELFCSSFRRRRCLGRALSTRGYPIYDKLERVLFPGKAAYNSCFSNEDTQENKTIENSKEYKHRSIDLGELREFMVALQDDAYYAEMAEMATVEKGTHCHYRRFSVDLGEVREFISLGEMKTYHDDKTPTHQEVDEARSSESNMSL